jgi:hypothetical protein
LISKLELENLDEKRVFVVSLETFLKIFRQLAVGVNHLQKLKKEERQLKIIALMVFTIL